MTMRSAPPCSAPFAEMPAPAPAPMIGSPCALIARKRARISERAMRGIALPPGSAAAEPRAEHAAEFVDDLRREIRFIDVLAQPNESARCGLPHRCFERSEKLLIGIG